MTSQRSSFVTVRIRAVRDGKNERERERDRKREREGEIERGRERQKERERDRKRERESETERYVLGTCSMVIVLLNISLHPALM